MPLGVAPRAFEPARVVITGIGLVTPLAIGADRAWRRLLDGVIGTAQLEERHVPSGHWEAARALPSQVVAPIDSGELELASQRLQGKHQSRGTQFARIAADEALAAAQLRPSSDAIKDSAGVCIGSGMAGVAQIAEAGRLVLGGKARRVTPYFVPSVLNNMAAGAVSMDHGLRGPLSSPSTACATGLHAVGEAFRTLQRRDAPLMLAGSAEACLDAVSLNGFCRMRALSTRFNDRPAEASRPFDVDRDGFVLGEGAGVLALETLEHAMARQAPIVAEVRGFGLSADAHHMSMPSPGGEGAALAMQRALRDAGVEAGSVQYVNAHATSTPHGDSAELDAIARVFGRERLASGSLKVSSTKGATGHLLGAAGAVEAAFTALAVQQGVCPHTSNLSEPHAELAGLLRRGEAAELPGDAVSMCNSFGFGGVNAALLLSRWTGAAA